MMNKELFGGIALATAVAIISPQEALAPSSIEAGLKSSDGHELKLSAEQIQAMQSDTAVALQKAGVYYDDGQPQPNTPDLAFTMAQEEFKRLAVAINDASESVMGVFVNTKLALLNAEIVLEDDPRQKEIKALEEKMPELEKDVLLIDTTNALLDYEKNIARNSNSQLDAILFDAAKKSMENIEKKFADDADTERRKILNKLEEFWSKLLLNKPKPKRGKDQGDKDKAFHPIEMRGI